MNKNVLLMRCGHHYFYSAPKLGACHTVEAQLLCCLQPSVFFGIVSLQRRLSITVSWGLGGVQSPNLVPLRGEGSGPQPGTLLDQLSGTQECTQSCTVKWRWPCLHTLGDQLTFCLPVLERWTIGFWFLCRYVSESGFIFLWYEAHSIWVLPGDHFC